MIGCAWATHHSADRLDEVDVSADQVVDDLLDIGSLLLGERAEKGGGAVALVAGGRKVVRKGLQDLHVNTFSPFAPATCEPDHGAFATDSEISWATALRKPRVLESLVEGLQIFEYSVALYEAGHDVTLRPRRRGRMESHALGVGTVGAQSRIAPPRRAAAHGDCAVRLRVPMISPGPFFWANH